MATLHPSHQLHPKPLQLDEDPTRVASSGGCFSNALRFCGVSIPEVEEATLPVIANIADTLNCAFALEGPNKEVILIGSQNNITPAKIYRVECDAEFTHAYSAQETTAQELAQRNSGAHVYMTPSQFAIALVSRHAEAPAGDAMCDFAQSLGDPSLTGVHWTEDSNEPCALVVDLDFADQYSHCRATVDKLQRRIMEDGGVLVYANYRGPGRPPCAGESSYLAGGLDTEHTLCAPSIVAHFIQVALRGPDEVKMARAARRRELRQKRKDELAELNAERPGPPLTQRQYFNDRQLASVSNRAEKSNDAELKKQVAELSKLVEKLRKEHNYKASNFSAANFMASSLLPSQILAAEEGFSIPGSTAKEAADLLSGVLKGEKIMPKRFGCDSRMMKVTCGNILSLSALTTGNMVVVMTPVNAAYKGALVFQTDASGTAPSVIGYVAPDRDPEEFSSLAAVSYAELEVSAPLVVGGTTTVVAQQTVESGVTHISPLATYAGKLAPLSIGRYSDMSVIGSDPHVVCTFTADEESEDVRRFSPVDKQDASLVRIPNASDQQEDGIMVSTPARCVRLRAGAPSGASAAISSGFLSDGGGTNTINYNTATTVWKWSRCSDFMRHMIYGHFRARVSGELSTALASVFHSTSTVTFTYSDGTTVSEVNAVHMASATAGASLAMDVTSYGGSAFAAHTGKYITDIDWVLESSISAACTITNPQIDFVFDEVNINTEYLAHVITGAVSAAQINCKLSAHVECFPDPSTEPGKYITPTPDLPYSTRHIPDLVRTLKHGPSLVYRKDKVHEASFWKTLKKVGKFAFNHGGRDLALGGISALNPVAGKVAGSFVPPHLSASFGDNVKECYAAGFEFPGVLDGRAKRFPIVQGIGAHPDFVGGITDRKLQAPGNWAGESADLAFLMAALDAEGWPVRSNPREPMLLSGDIEQLVRYGNDEIGFTLLPIKEAPTKNTLGGPRFIFGPEGIYTAGGLYEKEIPGSLLFSPSINMQADYSPGEKDAAGEWTKLPHWRINLIRK